MRTRSLAWSAVSFTVLLAACGGGGEDLPMLNTGDGGGIGGRMVVDPSRDGGLGGTAGGGTGGDGGAGGMGPADAGMTTIDVMLVKPAATDVVQAKSKDGLKPELVVTLTRAPGSTTVLDSVEVAVLDDKDMILTKAPLSAEMSEVMPESGIVTYRYQKTGLEVGQLPSGHYGLQVTARANDGSIVTWKPSYKIQIDAGPTIVIKRPAMDGDRFRGSANVDVDIDDKLFGPIQDVTATLGKYALTLTPSQDKKNYTAVIDFSAYVPPLDGEQLITVRAKNARATESVASRKFVVDNDGPTFANYNPAEGVLIGQVITVSVDVSDLAGVRPSSVVAVISNGRETSFRVNLDPPAPGAEKPTYSKLFDTRLLPINTLFPTVTFEAEDVLGNKSSKGYLVSLDNMPPLADLDPPSVRGWVKSGAKIECSWPFDPVGQDAVDDGMLVPQLFDVRARVEDRGNDPLSGDPDFIPLSLVDRTRVQLLAIDDTSQALVVDTNDDGICDALNPLLTPTPSPNRSTDALVVNMVPMNPGGALDLTPDPNSTCPGSAQTIPEPICDTVGNADKTIWHAIPMVGVFPHSFAMTAVMSYAVSNEPAIWTIPPIVNNRLECAGRQLDSLGGSLPDGWACMAVLAADKIGNAQASRVLRVCIDKDSNGAECPHLRVTSASNGTPIVITTNKPHGMSTGDGVFVSGVYPQTSANGRFLIDRVDDTRFALRGSVGVSMAAPATSGWAVPAAQVPDCTGTQTKKAPNPEVTTTKRCAPWRPTRYHYWDAPSGQYESVRF